MVNEVNFSEKKEITSSKKKESKDADNSFVSFFEQVVETKQEQKQNIEQINQIDKGVSSNKNTSDVFILNSKEEVLDESENLIKNDEKNEIPIFVLQNLSSEQLCFQMKNKIDMDKIEDNSMEKLQLFEENIVSINKTIKKESQLEFDDRLSIDNTNVKKEENTVINKKNTNNTELNFTDLIKENILFKTENKTMDTGIKHDDNQNKILDKSWIGESDTVVPGLQEEKKSQDNLEHPLSQVNSAISVPQVERYFTSKNTNNIGEMKSFIMEPYIEVYAKDSVELKGNLVDILSQNIQKNQYELELSLNPEHLGKMSIHISQIGDRTSISILCSTKEASQMVAEQAKEISRIMEQHLKTETLISLEQNESSYLEQDHNQSEKRSFYQEKRQRKQKEHESETQSFMEQLRLGLA